MGLHNVSKCGMIVLLFLLSYTSYAQLKQVNSPYSRNGIGSVQATQFSINRAMGGVATAFRSTSNVNFNNPASYSALKFATFEIGLEGEGLWLNTSNQSQKSGNGTPAYLALGLPVNKHWGMSLGILPYSYLNYDIIDGRYGGSVDTVNYRFIGNGQVYQVYWGNGWQYKNISAGVNLSYLFGTYNRQKQITFPTLENGYDNIYFSDQQIGGLSWNAGLQYKIKISDKRQIVVGASGNTGLNVNAIKNEWWQRAVINTNFVNLIDTPSVNENLEGKIVLPSKYSFGVGYKKGIDLEIDADCTFENWSEFSNFGKIDSTLQNNMRFNVGMAFVPDARADFRGLSNLLKRSTYRLGAYYNTGDIKIGNTSLSSYAVTAGFGVPIKRSLSRLNFSLEVGQKYSTNNQLIQETFVIGTVGFTLNDRWFIQRKFD